jgi:hypothetical protein
MVAPIALFVYNRPDHTRKTIEALSGNELAPQSRLIVFSDGPRDNNDVLLVEQVRDYISTIRGFESVSIIPSKANKGLANSIISGVTSVLSEYDRVIVLEDDLVTSPQFLRYMNNSLDFYENDEAVISIHGYIYPVKERLPDYFFVKGADCWGWATWSRGWKMFEPDGKILLKELERRQLLNEFDYGGAYRYSKMLKKQITGKNDSWAIRWYASAFIHEKLTLYPGKSYVQNIGNDASGTHSRVTNQFEIVKLNINLPSRKIEINEDVNARRVISDYFRSIALDPLKKFISTLLYLWRK